MKPLMAMSVVTYDAFLTKLHTKESSGGDVYQ